MSDGIYILSFLLALTALAGMIGCEEFPVRKRLQFEHYNSAIKEAFQQMWKCAFIEAIRKY